MPSDVAKGGEDESRVALQQASAVPFFLVTPSLICTRSLSLDPIVSSFPTSSISGLIATIWSLELASTSNANEQGTEEKTHCRLQGRLRSESVRDIRDKKPSIEPNIAIALPLIKTRLRPAKNKTPWSIPQGDPQQLMQTRTREPCGVLSCLRIDGSRGSNVLESGIILHDGGTSRSERERSAAGALQAPPVAYFEEKQIVHRLPERAPQVSSEAGVKIAVVTEPLVSPNKEQCTAW